MRHLTTSLTLLLLAAAMPEGSVRADESVPSFDIDVRAILSKAGCNAGTCHGNLNGKGGFRLSLRAQDADFDYRSLVGQYGGRRINRIDPENSLLLQKPTLQVPHQAGQRFEPGSVMYRLLHRWISGGAPGPKNPPTYVAELRVTPEERICFEPEQETQLKVEAVFSDGRHRDVTDMAVYEMSNLNVSVTEGGLVRREAMGEATIAVRYLNMQVPMRIAYLPGRQDYQWQGPTPRSYVDRHIFTKLDEFQVNPASRCADHVFLRRVFLDTLGILPTVEQAKSFAADNRPNKRDALVDRLLARPEFADHWAIKWSDLLRNEEKVLDRKGVEIFHGWIRDSMASGKPLDVFVKELLVARGSTYKNPPTNYFRALRESKTRGEAAARVFLGTRLQCAQCHNHPFDRWTQDDYYAWSALFARIDYKIIENKPRDKFDKNQFNGEQLVQIKDEGEVRHPDTGDVMPPRFLDEEVPLDMEAHRLEELAAWMTSPENRQFARAQVNRLWYHLMGSGLVEPVDDFRVTNPASHPDLLEDLVDDLIQHEFDIRHLLRVIMRSATYQLSSEEKGPTANYARVRVRRLTAEQILDAQSQVLDVPVTFNGHPTGIRAGQLPGVHKIRDRDKPPSAGDRFLFAFGKPERLMTCECERSQETTLSQALMLVNGRCIDDLLSAKENRLVRLATSGKEATTMIETLYWAALSRRPANSELEAAMSAILANSDIHEGLEDVAWALLNAKEFVFRQ